MNRNVKENSKKTTPIIKSATIKENRPRQLSSNYQGVNNRLNLPEDDQRISEESKMIIFATISHSQSAHLSSYSEIADRSERLRHYNLNETFSTSVLVTSIRDIPLFEPSLPIRTSESIPAWKLIRPRKSEVLPHAEPIGKYHIYQEIFKLLFFFSLSW